ncbi:MAG: hypothetical protein HKP61_17525 [Dactylosporangium sp.]|nr:hypothetical protein [Dactylosporangium sp.]NNJ62708.1 hypothetical protein [Dactylosporangium sp.]
MTLDHGQAYFAAMAQVAAAQTAYERECQEMRQSHTERVRMTGVEISQSVALASSSAERARSARALVDQIDIDVDMLWHEVLLAAPRGVGRARTLPEPESLDPDLDLSRHGGPATGVAVLLSEAYTMLERVRTGKRASPADYVGFAVLGVIGAALGVVAARILLELGSLVDGPIGVVLLVAGRLFAILSPLVGLLGIRWLLDRRAVHFGSAVIPVVVVPGIVTVISVVLFLPITG